MVEQEELAQRYVTRGVEPELARRVAQQLSRDPEQALAVHAREELGVGPHDLPSPLLAAGASFLAFAVGAVLPVLPYLFGATSLLPALVVAMIWLFAASLFTSAEIPRLPVAPEAVTMQSAFVSVSVRLSGTSVALPLSFSCPWTRAMINQTLSGYCSTILVNTAPR